MYDRLLHTYGITSRTILMRWARERYPDFFRKLAPAEDDFRSPKQTEKNISKRAANEVASAMF
jgi:hypothetical protein